MGLPWRFITVAALVAAYLTTYPFREWTRLSFLTSFTLAWLAQFSCWGVWAVILYPKLFSPLRGLPEPKNPSFFWGQYSRIAAEPMGAPQLDWANTVPNDGLIRYLGLLNQERLLITSPKALAEVLVTKNYDFPKPSQFRQSISRILGVGVLLAEGDEHKIQRKNLMPAFAFRHIKDLYPLFWQKSREVVQAMTEQVLLNAAKEPASSGVDPTAAGRPAGTGEIDVQNWSSRATLDIIGIAGLGRDFNAIKDPDNELNKTYRHLFKPSRQAQFLALLGQFIPNWIVSALPVRRNDDVKKAAQFIRATCRDLIREKKEKLARKEPTDPDILSVAIESGGFSDDNLVDQLMTFLAAGHETTASAMTWTIYMLSRYPEVQTRLRQEIREHLPPVSDAAAKVSSLDIDHMPYLNAVCSESLRYFAPVPMTFRESARDTSILGHAVPKGTRIMIGIWANNKDYSLWGPDASKFDPDRWLPRHDGDKSAASGGATSNYAFMTFLHGPRSCIGQAFSRAEFACLLAAWVGRFEFELKNKDEMDEKNVLIRGGITARPAKGLWVYAKVLDDW